MSNPVREEIRVVHIDDEPGFTDMVAEFLERSDERLAVETVRDPTKGLAAIRSDPPDCIVSDYEMPEMDGIELLRAVRKEHPDLPFILYTGRGSEEVASEGMAAGLTDYLQKGGTTSQYTVLANRITNAVEAARSATTAEQRRRRLEQILKTVPSCVVQLDAEGQFTFANQRAETVLGLESDEVTDRTYNDPEWKIRDLNGEPIPDEKLPFERIRETGEPIYAVKHTIEWPDGTRKVLSVNGAPIFDEGGRLESAVFSLTDITDQQSQDRELAETKRRLELALEATDTGVWEWDLATDEVTWNETLERAMGLAPGEFEGTFEAFTDRVHPDDRKRVQKLIEQAVETGSMYQTDFRMRHEDGTDRWVEVRGQVVHDARGERMVGVHHDITERKEREKELQTLKQQYQTLVEHFPDGAVFLFDTEYRYVRARGEGLGAVDLSPTDVEGKTPHDLFPEAIADELEHHYRAALDGTSHVFEQSYDGNHYRVQTAPVETEETGVTYGMAVSLDVTEQVEQRREIKRQNERLEEFASIVSHDLRNPIGIAYGKLELAAEDCESPDLDDAKAALERGERLIDDLLMLALRGADIGEPEEVRLSAVVRNAWADIETDRASLEITGEQTVTADRSYVRQLVENVLTNAVRHAGPDATVTVGALDDGFYIEDTGPGIPEDEHEEIFEVGYSAANGGTGFGLRIVEQIAAAHDWKVRVTEGTDGGARFEFVGMGEQ